MNVLVRSQKSAFSSRNVLWKVADFAEKPSEMEKNRQDNRIKDGKKTNRILPLFFRLAPAK